MSKELVVNSDGQTTRIAIVEKGELAELFIETEEHERTIGNLFVGRIRRVMPSIQAAFVDIGQKQDAFLHFSDLSESIPEWLEYIKADKPVIARFAPGNPQRNKGGKRRRPVSARGRKRLEDGAEDPEAELAEEQEQNDEHRSVVRHRGRGRRKAGQRPGSRGRGRSSDREQNSGDDGVPPESFLQRDQPILVKISKEPIAQKGSRVTTDISLAGRFLVLVPMANYVAVSKKISSFKERRRLRALAKMLLPDGFGVIVRTVAEGQNAKALDTDLRLLREKWTEIEKRLSERPKPPAAVYEDVNMVSSIMRDLFSEDFDRIVIDDQRMYRNIKSYVQAIAPDMAAKVRYHDKKTPVFRAAGIDRAVNEAFESRVNLPSGGYLYIEQTEAMHVIDVNSGRAGRGLSQEDNSLKVNLEAAKVIAKQIRLRDLGGILVIDFIDMRSERSRRKVYDQMKREFRKDRAVTKVLPMSDFGLMQITRQRLRPSITHTFSDLHEEVVADQDGTPTSTPADIRERERPRHVEPSEVIGRIEDWLEAFGTARWKGAIRLKVHPFTAAYLSRGLLGFALRCLFRYRIRVVLEESPAMEPGRFRFYDETNGKEIRRPPRRGRKKKDGAQDRAPRNKRTEEAAPDKPSDATQTQDSAQAGTEGDTPDEGRGRGRRGGSDGAEASGDSRSGSRSTRRGSRGGRGRRNSNGESSARADGEPAEAKSSSQGRGGRRAPRSQEAAEAEKGGQGSDGGRSGRSRQSEKAARSEKAPRSGKAAQSDQAPRSEQAARSDQAAQSDQAPQPAQAEKAAKSGKIGRSGKASESRKAPEPVKSDAAPASTESEKPVRGGRSRGANASTDEAPQADRPGKSSPGSEEAGSAPAKASAQPESHDAPAADSTPAPTAQKESPQPKPFKLRYSSSHVSDAQTASSEQG